MWHVSLQTAGRLTWTTVLPVGGTFVWAEFTDPTGLYSSWKSPYYGQVVNERPAISATPSAVDFGSRPAGSSTSKTVTITNVTYTEWRLANISITDGAYRVTGGTCTAAPLAGGSTCTFEITYAPTATSALEGRLTITGTLGDSTEVRLTGRLTVVPPGPPPAPGRPTVTAITPASGPATGGTRVTITGTNLVNVSAITFGTRAATRVTCPRPTTCTATSPRGAGTVHVRVSTPSGTSATSTRDRFRYRSA